MSDRRRDPCNRCIYSFLRGRRPEEERPDLQGDTERGKGVHISPDPQRQVGRPLGRRHRPQMLSDKPKVVRLSLVACAKSISELASKKRRDN